MDNPHDSDARTRILTPMSLQLELEYMLARWDALVERDRKNEVDTIAPVVRLVYSVRAETLAVCAKELREALGRQTNGS